MKKLFFLTLLMISCSETSSEKNPIEIALSSESEHIQRVMQNLQAHEVQIMLTDKDGNDVSFQVNDSLYFYPASSVKFPVALLALEKANEISKIDSNTLFSVEEDTIKTTIRKEVQKIFAVSDNEAYNRLFDFVGKDEINKRLQQKNLSPARISHRLSTDNAAATNQKVVTFYRNDSVVYQQKAIENSPIASLSLKKTQKGNGFYRNDSLIKQPMDFSLKNYLPVSTLHELMKRVQFPEKFTEQETFQFSQSDRDSLLKVMHKTPKKQGFTDDEYYDSYVKFFLFGDSKKAIPENIKIYNKVGYAYGYLTDCAHIVDTKHDISFTLTATIHVNENQIFNDDTYEYEEIGIPFLAALGREIHQYYISQKTAP